MSRIRKQVVPFRWQSFAPTFTQGTPGSINLATYLTNPQNRTITYGHTGTLPPGVTRSGATLSYNGTAAASVASVQFTATWSGLTATTAATPVTVQAVQVGNQPPVWSGSNPIVLAGPYTAGVGYTVPLAGYASDPDGDPMVFGRAGTAGDTAPGTFAVNTAGVLTIPASATPGTYTVVVEALEQVSQVTGVSATATAYNSVTVSWTAVTGSSDYHVERSLTGTGNWTQVGNPAATSFTDTTVAASTTYYYRVAASNYLAQGLWSASATATTPAVPSGERFEFAEIPEIVFVRGFAQSEHLGIFHLDTANRWTPGDLTNAAGWVPARATSVVGSLPAGVTYSSATGILTYDGSGATSASATATVNLTDGSVQSNAFRVRVLRPTLIWGTNALTDPAIAANFAGVPVADPADLGASGFMRFTQLNFTNNASDSSPNVMLILSGTYEAFSDPNGYGDFYLKDSSTATPMTFYILGDPRGRPVLKGNAIATSLGPQGARLQYYKDLELWDFSLKERSYADAITDAADKKTYYCNLYTHDQTRIGADGFGSDNKEGNTGFAWRESNITTYFWRLKAQNVGGENQRHVMYIEGRGNSHLYLNCCWINGGHHSSGCKSTRWYKWMANSYMSTFLDDADVTVGLRRQELIDWVGCGIIIQYNNRFRSGYNSSSDGGSAYGIINKRDRRDWWGSDTPAYPDVTWPTATTMLEGGYNPPPGFAAGPETFVNPAFWAAVRAGMSDDPAVASQNPYAFPAFVSYCTFEWVQEASLPRKAWFGDEGTAPFQAAVQLQNPSVAGTIPTDWTERSTNFALNNTLIGWVVTDMNDTASWVNVGEKELLQTNPAATVSCVGAYYDSAVGYWVNGPGPYPVLQVVGSSAVKPTRQMNYNAGMVAPWGGAYVAMPVWFRIK